MGTRCVITFKDQDGSHSIYQHYDGYPWDHGVISQIAAIVTSGKAWQWPRFEADEMAAAYIATHKHEGGNIRLTKGPKSHGDLSYEYVVKQTASGLSITYKGETTGRAWVDVFTELDGSLRVSFDGTKEELV